MGPPARLLLVALLVLVAGCGSVAVTDEGTPTGATPAPIETGTGASTTTPAAATTPASTGPTTTAVEFEPTETVEVTVTRVVDGDTLDVRFPDGSEDTVRLVGIDTPEVHVANEPVEYEGVPDTEEGALCLRRAGHDATNYTAARVDGATVTLAFDPLTDRRGGYDRLLAYVSVDGANLNHDLVATGHARIYDTEFSLREAFEASEAAARTAERGLWACRGG